MPSPRPRRLASFDYLGCHRYFVTCCTHDRRRTFERASVVELASPALFETARRHRFEILAYTFMPDHLHLLVEGTSSDSDFRRFISIARRRMTSACWSRDGLRLWQDGYHERVLRRDEDLEGVTTYLLENPVRAGLVDSREKYPYSWCSYGFDLGV